MRTIFKALSFLLIFTLFACDDSPFFKTKAVIFNTLHAVDPMVLKFKIYQDYDYAMDEIIFEPQDLVIHLNELPAGVVWNEVNNSITFAAAGTYHLEGYIKAINVLYNAKFSQDLIVLPKPDPLAPTPADPDDEGESTPADDDDEGKTPGSEEGSGSTSSEGDSTTTGEETNSDGDESSTENSEETENGGGSDLEQNNESTASSETSQNGDSTPSSTPEE